MTRPSSSTSLRLRLAASALLAGAACTGTHPEKPRPDAAPAEATKTAAPAGVAPPAPPAPAPAVPPGAPPVAPAPIEAPPVAELPAVTDEVATGEVAAGEVATGEVATGEVASGEVATGEVPVAAPAELVATAISPVAHAVSWREVVSLAADAAPQGFQYFATGVLAGAAPNFYTLDATGTWVAAAIGAPPGVLSGHWPDEAWSLEYGVPRDRAAIGRLRLHRLRGQTRWVPQAIVGEQWVESGTLGPLRKSWKVGYLAVAGDALVRVAGNGAEDPPLPVVRGTLMDVVESKAGDLFALSSQDGASYVQVACADEACVQASATPLPAGGWEWEHTVARQKHSVSISLRDVTRGARDHLLHYETGGWRLESLAGAQFAAIWPTADGGLWAQTKDALLHRDPDGTWRAVALPEGLQPSGEVFAAMRKDMSELLIVGVRGGAQVVLGTAAKAQTAG